MTYLKEEMTEKNRVSTPKKPGSREKTNQLEAKNTITVYVSTCQSPPVDLTSTKPDKFTTRVTRTSKLEDLQRFLLQQWMIANSSYATIPLEEHFYTFKGRILRLGAILDTYYIEDGDTIYVRFSSLGKVYDPWAMSTSELRVELKQRNAYMINLQPEQLMQRLQEEILKESRLIRLQRATKREEVEQVQAITKELAQYQRKIIKTSSGGSNSICKWPRPTSIQWPHPPCVNRTVFLSITELERTYQNVPRDVLEPALFIFDVERKWVFDQHNVLQKEQFDYRYMCFDQDFMEMLLLKEEEGSIFWFRPEKIYAKLYNFLISFLDPVTGKKYQPLSLKESKWLTLSGINGWEGKPRKDGRKKDTSKFPKFTKSTNRVVTNFKSNSFEYLAVQELLYQANPTLLFAPL